MGSFCGDGWVPKHFVGIVVVGTNCQATQRLIEDIDRYNAIATVVVLPS